MQFKAEHDAAVRQNESLELYALCGNGNGKYDYNYKYCISSTNSRTQEKKKIKKTRSGKTSRRTCDACEHKNKNAQRKVRKLCRRIAYNGRSIYTKTPPLLIHNIYTYTYTSNGGKNYTEMRMQFSRPAALSLAVLANSFSWRKKKVLRLMVCPNQNTPVPPISLVKINPG